MDTKTLQAVLKKMSACIHCPPARVWLQILLNLLIKELAAAINIRINERKSETSLTLQDKMLKIESEIKKKLHIKVQSGSLCRKLLNRWEEDPFTVRLAGKQQSSQVPYIAGSWCKIHNTCMPVRLIRLMSVAWQACCLLRASRLALITELWKCW